MNTVLVINVGSTSFKFQLIEPENGNSLCRGNIQRVFSTLSSLSYSWGETGELNKTIDTTKGYQSCIEQMLELLLDDKIGVIKTLSDIIAIGFKAVHAGAINYSVIVSPEVLEQMRRFSTAAPAHNPPYIEAMETFLRLLPEVPQVAVFETSFHCNIPLAASTYSIPFEWEKKYGARKYGFHGASHRYISEKTPEVLNVSGDDLRIISCHLGGSSSVCAIKNGQSIDTSMGFSPQSGITMSTRCGDLDPYLLLYIMEEEKLDIGQMRRVLAEKSGLLGISGISGDVRDLEESNDKRAALALDVFAYEVKKYIAAYAGVMNGVDVLVFTGGIGENDYFLREKICCNLTCLDIEIDREKNLLIGKDSAVLGNTENIPETGAVISKAEARVKILVIPANEEVVVCRETVKLVKEYKQEKGEA